MCASELKEHGHFRLHGKFAIYLYRELRLSQATRTVYTSTVQQLLGISRERSSRFAVREDTDNGCPNVCRRSEDLKMSNDNTPSHADSSSITPAPLPVSGSAEGLITSAPSAAPAPPAAKVAAVVTPHVDRYATHYERYNGPIGQGANKTTHTAVVRFGNEGHHLAVVKAFTYLDKGWLNEAIAWTVGRIVKLAQPPRAMLLVATLDELAQSKDPEIARAYIEFAPMKAPVVLWCASRLDTKPPQHLSALHWEDVALRGTAGQRLAAFDGWIGNADRHADNAPYWVSRGVVAAIDHERLAFAQDWRVAAPQHLDRTGQYPTKLLHRFHVALKAKKFTSKQARDMMSAMRMMSDAHAVQLAACWGDIESRLLDSVDAAAKANLRHFFDERASDLFICDRFGTVV